mmetsp:Transcript_18414/g.31496  ORF Transcript_18414/g.31496 Transcript_18414/m.31496 type:complete len:89 (-) Transcript_18414:1038-1304(-)
MIDEIAADYKGYQYKRRQMIRDLLLRKVREEALDECFFFNDMVNARIRIAIWRKVLPRVELFYAVKTNPDEEIVKICEEMSTGFDVAT